MNVYIIGNLNDKMTGSELEKTLDQYREAENQLACFGYGVLSPHHLPADLRGTDGAMIRAAMIQASDICYALDYAFDIELNQETALSEQFNKPFYHPGDLYDPDGILRQISMVEKITDAKED